MQKMFAVVSAFCLVAAFGSEFLAAVYYSLTRRLLKERYPELFSSLRFIRAGPKQKRFSYFLKSRAYEAYNDSQLSRLCVRARTTHLAFLGFAAGWLLSFLGAAATQ